MFGDIYLSFYPIGRFGKRNVDIQSQVSTRLLAASATASKEILKDIAEG